MKRKLINILKTICSDIRTAIISIILGLIIVSAALRNFAKSLWIAILQAMQLPTPLWGTIALVLVLWLYIYLKNRSYKKHLQEIANLQAEITQMKSSEYTDQIVRDYFKRANEKSKSSQPVTVHKNSSPLKPYYLEYPKKPK